MKFSIKKGSKKTFHHEDVELPNIVKGTSEVTIALNVCKHEKSLAPCDDKFLKLQLLLTFKDATQNGLHLFN